jgi:hypothetical protein
MAFRCDANWGMWMAGTTHVVEKSLPCMMDIGRTRVTC